MKAAIRTAVLYLVSLSLQAQGPPGPPPPPGPGPPPPGGQSDGIWLRNAIYGERHTLDACLGHQPETGLYHHHAQPICLRAQLEDNVEVVKTSRTGTIYRESSGPYQHSPILGLGVRRHTDLRTVRLL